MEELYFLLVFIINSLCYGRTKNQSILYTNISLISIHLNILSANSSKVLPDKKSLINIMA